MSFLYFDPLIFMFAWWLIPFYSSTKQSFWLINLYLYLRKLNCSLLWIRWFLPWLKYYRVQLNLTNVPDFFLLELVAVICYLGYFAVCHSCLPYATVNHLSPLPWSWHLITPGSLAYLGVDMADRHDSCHTDPAGLSGDFPRVGAVTFFPQSCPAHLSSPI